MCKAPVCPLRPGTQGPLQCAQASHSHKAVLPVALGVQHCTGGRPSPRPGESSVGQVTAFGPTGLSQTGVTGLLGHCPSPPQVPNNIVSCGPHRSAVPLVSPALRVFGSHKPRLLSSGRAPQSQLALPAPHQPPQQWPPCLHTDHGRAPLGLLQSSAPLYAGHAWTPCD